MELKPSQDNFQSQMTAYYSKEYQAGSKHDSPEQSRISLIRRLADLFERGFQPGKILDIGSGPQSLEKQFRTAHQDKNWFTDLQIVTVDIANISREKLLEKNNPAVNHVRASSLKLPFADNSFGLVVSNHAIDFLPPEAFNEAARVLKADGKAIFNFHHPSMLDGDQTDPQVKIMWKNMKANKQLFETPEQIKESLLKAGFVVNEIGLKTYDYYKWWEVVARKKS